jgi:hypothetical protein
MSDIAKFIVYENDEYIYFEPVSDKEDAIEKIINDYYKYDTSMYDLLACTRLDGFSLEDNVYIYATCMKISDGDSIIHIRDEEWGIIAQDYERLGRY